MADTSKKSRKFWVIFGFFLGITFAFMAARYLNSEYNRIHKTEAQQELTNLTTSNFKSPNISQWTNDAGYLSVVNYSQLQNGTTIFFDYRPNNVQCANGQILRYDQPNSRWICSDDAAGDNTGGLAWGGITGSLSSQADLQTALNSKLSNTAVFGGDLSGSFNNLTISDDSHNHTGATITGLTTTDFASGNISQWTNDAGYITGADFSDITNGSGIYLDYRPNNTACAQGEILIYDAGLSRWICGVDSGAGSLAWGGITGTLSNQADLNSALIAKLDTTATFGGDVTGTYGNLSVTDDTHNHTGATISGLGVTDFTSQNISQWVNDAGFISGLNHSQVTNGSGIYWDYRPNDSACSQDQVLKYDAGLTRWVCATDVGASSTAWGAITGTLANQTDLNNALTAKLGTGATFGGDISGTYNNIAIADDSHNHTAATISGLTTADFTSPNISQWNNDSGFISGVNYAQIANGANIYMNYKPNNVSCSQDQTLKYDASLTRWVCGNDNGAGTIAWGSITGTLADQSDLSTALSSKLNLTANFTGDISGTYDNVVILNDSHNHTGATITGLGVSNFTSQNISQWTNDSGYIRGVDITQVTNGAGKYFNYKPNDVACTNGQILEYDATNFRWICANDDTGGGGGGSPVSVTKENLQVSKVLYESTLGADAASFDIQNIDQSYTHLLILLEARTTQATTGTYPNLAFNNDTNSSNYRRAVGWNGSTNGGQADDSSGIGGVPGASSQNNDYSATRINIQNYSASGHTKNATVESGNRRSATESYIETQLINWENTAAINRITLTPPSSNFVAGSKIQVIGYKNMDIVTDVTGGGGVQTIGSMTGTSVFASSTADDDWLGLGASAARIEFDDQATDEIQLLNANVIINGTQPQHTLDVNGNIGIATSGYLNFGAADGNSGYGFRDNAGVLEFKNNSGNWTPIGSGTGGGGVVGQDITIPMLQFKIINGCGGSFIRSATAQQYYNFEIWQTTPAAGDIIQTTVNLAAGTYTFYALGRGSNNRGIIDWSIDGQSPFITGQDWYSASDAPNTIKSGTVTITESGRHTLRLTVTGKNAASSNYYFVLTSVYFVANNQTTDTSGGGGSTAVGSPISGATAGSVLFSGAGGVLAQDNANIYWDDANNRLGIGTITPTVALDVNGTIRTIGTQLPIQSSTPATVAGASTVYAKSATSADDGFSELLLHMNGADGSSSFIDSSYNHHSIDVGENAQIDTAESKFGGASAQFDGTNDYISIPDSSEFEFGSGNFTIDLWVRFNTNSVGYQPIINNFGTGDQQGWTLIVESNNKITFIWANTTSWVTSLQWPTTPSINTWYHVAIVRQGSTYTMYINGTSVASANSSGYMVAPIGGIMVGRYLYFPGGARTLDGRIDEVRISKGVARWTTNFTPPISEYSGTKSNLYWIDENGNDFALTNNSGFTNGGNSGVSTVGSMTSSTVFSGASADDQWLGFGSTSGRIEFDDQAVDEIQILNASLGIGVTQPQHLLDVNGNIGIVASGYLNFGSTDGSSGYGIRDNNGKVEVKNNNGTWSEIDDNPSWAINPDKPPVTPNAMDDEFNDGSVNGKWTSFNQLSGQTITEQGHTLVMETPTNIQGRVFALMQTAPSGTWKIRTKMFQEGATWNYFGYGLIVRRTTGADKSLEAGQLWINSNFGQTLYAIYLNGTSYASEVDLYNVNSSPTYLEVEYDGTNIIWRHSTSGEVYVQFYSVVASTAIGGAPEQVGLFVHPYGDNNANWKGVASFDWFRRIQ